MTIACLFLEILRKLEFSVMAAANLHIYEFNLHINIFFSMIIVISDHYNMGLDTSIMTIACLCLEILRKLEFSVMAAANLHIYEFNLHINIFFSMIIVISDHENMGLDT